MKCVRDSRSFLPPIFSNDFDNNTGTLRYVILCLFIRYCFIRNFALYS